MTSSWFFLSTLNYDARSTTRQIRDRKFTQAVHFKMEETIWTLLSVPPALFGRFSTVPPGRTISPPSIQRRILWTAFFSFIEWQNSQIFEAWKRSLWSMENSYELITVNRCLGMTNICSGYDTSEDGETIINERARICNLTTILFTWLTVFFKII